MSAAGLKSLRHEDARTIEPAQALAAEAMRLEHRRGDLINAAYGLTPEEVAPGPPPSRFTLVGRSLNAKA